jgi:beta-lactamase regulating signal transducer with metallopeptidase domain
VDIVLNWLWQGAVIALAAAAGLRVIPKSRPQARYAFVWVGYAVVLTLPAAPHLLTAASPIPSPVDVVLARDATVSIPSAWWTSSSLVLGLWLAWFSANAVRLTAAVMAMRRTKRECLGCPPGLEARLPLWSRLRSTGRPTRLVVCSRVRSAAVLGCGEPVIALAPVLLERLDVADLDRVVLHEWSHVQRRDDRAQFVQQVLHAAVGWHPAVWWLERQLALEREAACDLASVALTGSARRYAACLATLAALPAPPARVVAALAAASPSGLRQRVVRILSHRVGNRRTWRAIAVCASLALVPIALAVGSLQIIEAGLDPVLLSSRPLRSIASTFSAPARPVASRREEPNVREAPLRAVTAPAESTRGSSMQPSRAVQEPNTAAIAHPSISTAAVSPPAPALTPEAAAEAPVSTNSSASTATPATVPEVLTGAGTAPPQQPAGSHDATPPETTTDGPRAEKSAGQTPWSAAAEAGRAIGRGSQVAGVKTAGFFGRLGKKIAGSF